jgi:hypothetical protein
MKKLYTFLFACSFTVLGFAQVEVYEYAQSTEISGTTVTRIVDVPGSVYTQFAVKNTSGDTVEIDITRLRIDVPASWSDGLTWQNSDWIGAGYSSAQMPTNPWTTPFSVPLDTMESGNLLSSVSVGAPGTGRYRYYMSVDGTVVDSIDVLIIHSTASVEEPEAVKGMTAYPNPANDVLTVSATGMEEYRIRMTDVLGKIVYDETASAPKKAIDVSDFKNGVYILTVLEKGTVIRTRRVVVKH